MSISETGDGYYCFRNSEHAGRNYAVLFKKLGVPYELYKKEKLVTALPEYKEDKKDYSAINYFLPAEESEEAVNYLFSRGFLNPEEACQKFGLLVADCGKWAGRLIIPLTVGWTGRAMRQYLEPRYLSHTNEDGFLRYSNNSTTCAILEGPLDLMRIATVTTQLDLIAKTGSRLSNGLLYYLRSKGYRTIINSPDTDVSYEQYEKETRIIRSYCSQANVKLFRLPEQFKDWGETSETEARQLVRSL